MQKKMLVIRDMTESDLEVIAALESAIFPDAWSLKSICETFHQEQTFIVVAELDGRMTGYGIIYFALDEAEIARIAVEDSCRRQGVGREILNQVEKICKEKGIRRLLLDVRESNETARGFYLSYGFIEDGARKNFYDMPKENAVLMSKTVGNTGITSHYE